MKLVFLQDKIKCVALRSVATLLKGTVSSNPNVTHNESLKVYRVAVMKEKTGKNARHVQEQNRERGGRG